MWKSRLLKTRKKSERVFPFLCFHFIFHHFRLWFLLSKEFMCEALRISKELVQIFFLLCNTHKQIKRESLQLFTFFFCLRKRIFCIRIFSANRKRKMEMEIEKFKASRILLCLLIRDGIFLSNMFRCREIITTTTTSTSAAVSVL